MAPRRPSSTSWSTRLRRSETSAISAATKTALSSDEQDDDPDLEERVAHQAGGSSRDGAGRRAPGPAAAAAGRARSGRISRIRAGTPTASFPAGTSFVTTAPAPVFDVVAQGDGRPQHRVHAQEDALPDRRPVLAHAVVVGGDRARAHVRVAAHVGVAEVAVVVLADVLAQPAVLDLRVVADLGPRPDVGPRAQVRERPDRDVVLHRGPLDDAGPDRAPLPDRGVDDLRPAGDAGPGAHRRAAAQDHVRLQRRRPRPGPRRGPGTRWTGPPW